MKQNGWQTFSGSISTEDTSCIRCLLPAHVKKSGVHMAIILWSFLMLPACSTMETKISEPADARMAEVAGQCPQPRETDRAPDSYYTRKNPLPKSAENLERGRNLYHQNARPTPCASCHGNDGDGKGPEGRDLVPPPRNFTCAATMDLLSDGQLYWVIETGSGPFHLPSKQEAQTIERPGRRTRFTAMRAHQEYLNDIEIWQLVMYIRTFQADR
jgi:cytochrome c553